MVLEAIAEFQHPLRQLLRQHGKDSLGDGVGRRRAEERQLGEHAVGPALQGEQAPHLPAARVLQAHKRVFAIACGQVEGAAAHVFPGDRQLILGRQDLAAQSFQLGRAVGADVEGGGVLLAGEGAGAHGEDHDLAGAAGSLVQEGGVRIEPGRAGHDLPHVIGIAGGAGVFWSRGNVLRIPPSLLQGVQQLFGILAESDAEVIDQLKLSRLGHPGVDGVFRERWPLAHLAAAGVVGDAAHHRCADGGRADHGVRLTMVRGQGLLEIHQGGPGQAHRLTRVVEEVNPVDAQGGEDDDVAIVALVCRSGASGESGVGGLRDDGDAVLDAHLQGAPHLGKGAGAQHREHPTGAEPVALHIGGGGMWGGEHVGATHDRREGGDCWMGWCGTGRAHGAPGTSGVWLPPIVPRGSGDVDGHGRPDFGVIKLFYDTAAGV